ncbi:MAG TPA: HDOD domain-containing protein [Tepidisphaeraceae bacterium]|nr:HDOD domain-containing protein [Tepidisphaeraceae bacterium]
MGSLTSQPVLPPPPSADAMIRQAIRKVQTIATLPEITSEIIRVAQDPTASAQTLKKIISNDPALVTRILKVVNSAFYGLAGQITGIDRAIVILGFNEIKSIALISGFGDMIKNASLSGPFTAKDLWRHCVAVGIASREIAKLTRDIAPPEAFLAGLIHDLGLLVHLQLNAAKLSLVCQTVEHRLAMKAGPVNFCAVERSILGIDHEQLGQALTENWNFPTMFQQVIGFHHHPKQAMGDFGLVGLVHIADTIVCKGAHGFNLTAVQQEIEPSELERLRLDPEKLQKVNENLTPMIDEVLGHFK